MSGNTRRIAFIGFGEVGQRFARGFLANEGLTLTAYDILADAPAGAPLARAAREIGVTLLPSAAAAVAGAEIVISAVTASQAEPVALGAAAFLAAGQFYLDVNSAAPATKQAAARHVDAAGAHYVEAAVMAPVMRPGLAVPILAGGPRAEAAAALLNPLGMNLTVVASEYGRASAMKLCRSIIIKGMEALLVDCAAACEKWDVREEVFESLAETFPSIDWFTLSDNMRERVHTHGVRRSAEMHEAAEMLAALGMEPGLVKAVAEAQLRGAGRKQS